MTWKVELLDQTVEAELMSLPADMQARFLHIAELLETFGPQRRHAAYPPIGTQTMGNALIR